MRRMLAGITVALLVVSVTAVALAAETGSYRDQFDAVGYSGSNGNRDWSTTPWIEVGESNGPTSGKVQVEDENCPQGDYYCLAILGGGLNLNDVGASRRAGLGDFGSAELSFRMNVVLDLLGPDATLSVQASEDGGTTWDTLRTYALALNSGESQQTIPLDNVYLQDDFAFRLVVSGLLGGSVYIDDVRIEGPLTTTTTTSTTSTTSILTVPTLPILTTSTTSSSTTSTTSSSSDDGESSTTSTTAAGETTTTLEEGGLTAAVGGSPPSGGIRLPALGIQADFAPSRFGDFGGQRPDILGVDFKANYMMAVEVIESAWIWILALVLLIATVIVSGLDRRQATGRAMAPNGADFEKPF